MSSSSEIPLPSALERVVALDPVLAEELRELFLRLARAGEAMVWAQERLGKLLAAMSASELLSFLVDEARALTGAPSVWAVTLSGEPSSGRVSFQALAGAAGEGAPPVPAPEEISRTIVGRVMSEGRPAFSDDARADARFDAAQSVQAFTLRSVGCLSIGKRGFLYLQDPKTPGRFSLLSRARLSALCALAGPFLEARLAPARAPREEAGGLPGIVGEAAAMRELFRTVRAFAPMPWPALILGETGTGKEAVAQALHTCSPRQHLPFVAQNCGAIPEELAESLLFGHERGAFTGADRRREGLLERVGGGTLFLDEVGELSPRLQVKLLRLLQEGVYERLGGERELRFSGRVVAATLRPLDDPEKRGAFREDLYHRLAACVLKVPPLRERRRDIPALAEHLLQKALAELPGAPPLGPVREPRSVAEARDPGPSAALPLLDDAEASPRQGALRDDPVSRYLARSGALKQALGLRQEAKALLMARDWPGNVRELENEIRGAVARCLAQDLDLIQPEHFSPQARLSPKEPAADLIRATEVFQREQVLSALSACKGSRTQAAARLGVSRQWLHRLLTRWGAGKE